LQPRPQPRGLPTTTTNITNIKITTKRINVVTSIRDARFEPQRSKSQQLRRLLVAVTKREEKENDNQHEAFDKESCK
jgi:hypothetical protein